MSELGFDQPTPTRDRLRDIYRPQWWPWLIPVCTPFEAHSHKGKPCTSQGKVPIERKWNARAAERAAAGGGLESRLEQLEQHLDRGGNVGMALPRGIIVFDADNVEAAGW